MSCPNAQVLSGDTNLCIARRNRPSILGSFEQIIGPGGVLVSVMDVGQGRLIAKT